MRRFLICNVTTGVIESSFERREPPNNENLGVDFIAIESDKDIATHYYSGTGVDDSSLLPRPSLSITFPTSVTVGQGFVVTGIPEGAEVVHPSGSVTMDSSEELSYTIMQTGKYKFYIKDFPNLNLEPEIAVTV